MNICLNSGFYLATSKHENNVSPFIASGSQNIIYFHIDVKSANGIINNLIHVTSKRGLMYVGDIDTGYNKVIHRLEHLSCFLPGTLALGAAYLHLSPEEKELHQWAAEGLAYTCDVSYADHLSGLGPDTMNMPQDGKKWVDEIGRWKAEGRKGKPPGTTEPPPESDASHRDYFDTGAKYLLRPEVRIHVIRLFHLYSTVFRVVTQTVESIFYMWRLTGDVKWRQRGYDIFQAIEKHTRTTYGYASVYGVDSLRPNQMDDMPR